MMISTALSASMPREGLYAHIVISVWNALPSTVNFSKLSVFRSSIAKIDFSSFLICNVD